MNINVDVDNKELQRVLNNDVEKMTGLYISRCYARF